MSNLITLAAVKNYHHEEAGDEQEWKEHDFLFLMNLANRIGRIQ
ncbi:hypothetical protein [Lysinibacillus fusiformis]|nr:hypothetical protein [Lysinibacillus fusiformis]